MAAFLLMLPLALTSTRGWIRRLGGKRWQALHRLVYASAAAGVIHFYWLVKSDIREPVFYGVIVAALLGWRLARRLTASNAAKHAETAQTTYR
jgi:sulfoxide reductase heme-binding subunit YedZ